MNVNRYLKIPILFLAILMLAMPALANTHSSNVTVDANVVPPSTDNIEFTTTVTWTDGPDSIHEFRVYFEEFGDNTPFTDFDCKVDSAGEWNGPFYAITSIDGKDVEFCFWTSKAGNELDEENPEKTFSFTADSPEEDCYRTWRMETRDPNQYYVIHMVDVAVDAQAPITTKQFIGPQKIDGQVEWIDGVTTIELTAVDPDPHPIGVDKTWYRVGLQDDDACLDPATYCPDTEQSDEEIEEFVECGLPIQNECKLDWEGYNDWQDCTEQRVYDKCDVPTDWKIYRGPIGDIDESCHSIHFFSIDNLGNWENPNNVENRNCFFVDKTPPEVDKEVGDPEVPCEEPELLFGETYEDDRYTYYSGEDFYDEMMAYGWDLYDYTHNNPYDDFWREDTYPHTADNYYFVIQDDSWKIISIDTTGFEDIELTYMWRVKSLVGGDFQAVYWRVGDAGEWTLLADNISTSWSTEVFDLIGAGNQSEIQIKFMLNNGNDNLGFFDNIEVTGKAPGDCDHWVTPETDITFTCTDQGPHPSGDEELCFIVSYDLDQDGYNTDEYCASYGGNFEDPYCCISATPQTPFVFNFNEDEESLHDLEYYCRDAVEKESQIEVQYYRVDETPPLIVKDVIAPKEGICPPGDGDECFITDESIITVTVSDPDPTQMSCNIGVDYCEWWYEWDNQNYEGGQFTNYTEISFNEDSEHILHIECYDLLGNYFEDVETFLVDLTPPETVKTYGDPYVSDGYPSNPEWITSQTKVFLNATDEKVGVDEIYWRNMVISNPDGWNACENPQEFCNPDYYMQEGIVDNPETQWNIVDGNYVEFYKQDESCHVIEFYSIDIFGNEETLNYQCPYVDNTHPEGLKEVGDPKVLCEDDDECDYYVSQETPIYLSCEDMDPHPVENEIVWWRFSYHEDDEWTYSEWFWEEESVTVYFEEDSFHDLEFYCEDALGNENEIDTEYFYVDTEPPIIDKNIVGPRFGDCDLPLQEGDICFIDGVTEIQFDSYDPLPHPVGDVECRWGYWLDDEQWFGWYEGSIINFPEETEHELVIECWDALENLTEDVETFYVDKTPPGILKEYGDPYQAYEFEDYWAEWISLETPIYAGVTDDGPHKSGIYEVKYRTTMVDDAYCEQYYEEDKFDCEDAAGDGEWNYVQEYGEFEFGIDEESCHLIEIYAEDNVAKNTLHKQCVFVDDTAPETIKNVGEPKTEGSGKFDWKVTTMTPIELTCNDPEPHPVNHNNVCFYVGLDGKDVTEGYCDTYEGNYNENEDGFCCLEGTIEEFKFTETTEHNLQFYCQDALDNTSEIDDEMFKVEGTAFEIQINWKWNLISVPFALLNPDVEEVLGEIEENVESIWTYDAFEDEWYVYTPDELPNDSLHTLDPGWGYWLRANDDTTLTIGGSLFSPIISPNANRNIKAGWNLIGYYGTDDGNHNTILEYHGPGKVPPFGQGKTAYCALFSLGPQFIDKGFSALVGYWQLYDPEWWPISGYSYDDRLDPGAGYWVFALQDGVYSYTTWCK